MNEDIEHTIDIEVTVKATATPPLDGVSDAELAVIMGNAMSELISSGELVDRSYELAVAYEERVGSQEQS